MRTFIMLKWVCAILAVACVVLAVCLYSSHQVNRQLAAEKKNLTTALTATRREEAQTREKSATLVQTVEALQQQLKQRQTGTASTTLSTAVVAESAKTDAETVGTNQAAGKNTDFMGKFKEVMKNPEMQDAMRAQQKVMLGMMYGALFKKLNLSPDALDKFKELLLDRQMAGMAAVGADDGKAAMADVAAMQKEVDQTMKTMLNDEQYKTYQDYQETLGERFTLNQLTQQLADKSMPLDDAQQEELVTLMVEERQKLSIASVTEQQQQALANGGMPTPEMMAKQLQQQEELQQHILDRAGEILSDAQIQELKTFLENQIKMQKLGLEFMKNFAGGEKK